MEPVQEPQPVEKILKKRSSTRRSDLNLRNGESKFTEVVDLRRTANNLNTPRLILFGRETYNIRSTRTLLDYRFLEPKNPVVSSKGPRLFVCGRPIVENPEDIVREPVQRKRSKRS